MTGRLWPDTEISAVDLVAEYLPFNSVERKQSRCNNQRQVVADSSLLRLYPVVLRSVTLPYSLSFRFAQKSLLLTGAFNECAQSDRCCL